jgi:DinB superfamily
LEIATFICFLIFKTQNMSTKEALELRLSCQHESAMTVVLQLSDALLKQRPATDKWSIFENFAHLVRYQNIFIERVERILTQENPIFERYSAENDANFSKWLKFDKDKLLHILINDRYVLYNSFRELSDDDLDKTGVHPAFGKLDLADWHEFFLLHEAHHIFTMFKLLKLSQHEKG